jgi:hypothetical protein
MPRRLLVLLTLILVGGPLAWLVFTKDGQRRADLFFLPLFGRPTVDLSLADLNSRLHEEDLRVKLPGADLQCVDEVTPFGGRVCTARIGAFARLPAESLTFFLARGDLRAAKLKYRRDVHAEVAAYLSERLGEGDTTKRGPDGSAALVTNWSVLDGLVLTHAGDLAPQDEAAVLWMSGLAVEERARLHRIATPPGP